jgi:uncharacterized membrane protein YeaQ/YmgE (transglycosylase-associated protein family)
MGTLIIVILAGAFIGWLASKIMHTDASMGAIANIGAGIVGAAIGRFIAPMLGFREQGTDFSIGGIIFGVIGACILIGIVKLLTGGRRSAV